MSLAASSVNLHMPGRLPASADRLNPTNKSCNAAAPFYDIVNAYGGIVCQEDIRHEEHRATHRQNRRSDGVCQ